MKREIRIERVTDPEQGPLDGVKLHTSCAVTRFAPADNPEAVSYTHLDGYSEREMLLAATRYAEQCLRERTEDRYIKRPKTFLSDALPFLDYLDPTPGETASATEEDGGNPFAKYKRGDEV